MWIFLAATLGMCVLEDRGHEDFKQLPPRPVYSEGLVGDDAYARRVGAVVPRFGRGP